LQERAGNRSVSAAAKVIQDEVKARAPIREVPAGTGPGKRITAGKPKLRFPGNLRKRVIRRKVSKRGDSRVHYIIGFAQAAWYGRLVEMGTKTAAPHPFMRPAIDAKGNASIDKFRDELGGQIDAAVKASQ